MKLTTLLIIGLSFHFLCAFSQSDKDINDIINFKKQNLKYQKRIEIETAKSFEFYNLAVANTQSAKLILNKIIEGSPNEDSDKEIASLLFHKANIYTNRSDSIANLIVLLQDSIKTNSDKIYAIAKDMKVNEQVNEKPLDTYVNEKVVTDPVHVEAVKPEMKKEEVIVKTEPVVKEEKRMQVITNPDKTYTVQIKADKQSGELIKGMANLRVVKGNDGYYRYFVGEYRSFADASKIQKKLSGEGYSDCFVKVLK